ncbi:MAG: asparagine synthase (glutamine-hydrolyzing) [Hyphomicrobiales bacterium]|nr:asparagine synthase (glutamine-hydrolyzing) [Hyphomicrobiales bacterium]
MCGIAGVIRFDGRDVSEGELRRMVDVLSHRGPDEDGYQTFGAVGFGHRRLSIIDPAGSHQPMSREHVTITFNGEIFNYQELRRSLEDQGAVFQTNGDTEVILALYLAKGPDFVDLLDGQFALGLYDSRSRQTWLYRDRMGILPLYYVQRPDGLYFASEIKSILRAVESCREINWESVRNYLFYRSIPSPDTLFGAVKKLPPGCRMRIGPDGRTVIDTYWTLDRGFAQLDIPLEDAIARVDAAINQAIRSRLVADVPVGAYLSGGVDSSLIVQIMRRLRGGDPIETYSAGFENSGLSELPYARKVSALIGSNHHEVIVRPRDYQDLWETLTWHRDGPLSEPADVALYKLAVAASKDVKVLLSGEGSDEIFAGYPKYRLARLNGLAGVVPAGVRRVLLGALERNVPEGSRRLRIALRALSAGSELQRVQSWFASFTREECDQLLGPGAPDGDEAGNFETGGKDALGRMLQLDCQRYLPDNLLERGDRMTMAASVECRPPFLDHNLVELAFSLPSSLKVRGGTTKWILKRVARSYLPAEIIDRPKLGFKIPLDDWFRSELRGFAQDKLLGESSFSRQFLSRPFIERMLHRHMNERADEASRIWTLLCLEIWHETFFKDAVSGSVAQLNRVSA